MSLFGLLCTLFFGEILRTTYRTDSSRDCMSLYIYRSDREKELNSEEVNPFLRKNFVVIDHMHGSLYMQSLRAMYLIIQSTCFPLNIHMQLQTANTIVNHLHCMLDVVSSFVSLLKAT